jgi:adenosylcobinamide-GDP ribazoletransferase
LWAVFPSITANPVLAAWPLYGRFSAALIPRLSKPQREDGLGALAKNASGFRCVLGLFAALLLYLGAGSGLYALSGVLSFAPERAALLTANTVFFWEAPAPLLITAAVQAGAAFFSAVFFAGLYRKRLGGYSGDALGAAIETGEIAALFAGWVLICR